VKPLSSAAVRLLRPLLVAAAVASISACAGRSPADGAATQDAATSPDDVVSPGDSAGATGSGGIGGAGGAAGAAGAAGSAGAPSGADGGCPTAAPFDDSNAALVSACTVPIAVAVGNGLRRASSHDGVTWDHDVYMPDTGTDQNENSHRDVLVARGLIFVVGDGGLLVSSDGGETFPIAKAGRFHDSALVYFQGVIWALTNLGTLSTTDGKTWNETAAGATLPGNLPGPFSGTGGAAVSSASKLVAISGRNTSARVWDGVTWSEHAFDPTAYGSLGSAAFGDGRFVIVGGACCDKTGLSGLRATSPDGVTWTPLTNATAGAAATLRFGSVIWQGTHFFATATQYDKRSYTSTDGLAWTISQTNVGIGAVAVFKGSGGTAYLGANAALIYRSDDGVTWTLVHTGIGDAKWGYTAIRSGVVLAH
jgi:hypothetical protein